MEKVKLNTEADLQKAIEYFGEDSTDLMKSEIKSYPCFIIGAKYKKGYDFISVSINEFK